MRRRTSWTALFGAGLVLVACGPPDVAVTLTMSQALHADVDVVEIRVLGVGWDCATLEERVDQIAQLGRCQADAFDGTPPCTIASTQQSVETLGESLVQLFVPPGDRHVFVTGFDAEGARIATGCVGPVTVESGATTEVRVPLD